MIAEQHNVSGFTLLEVMVALMITAMVMTITYASLRGLMQADETATEREEQLLQWMQLQTLLQRDGDFLKPGNAAAFQLLPKSLKAQYEGSVVPNMRLGTDVAIEYHWQIERNEDGENQIHWFRNFYHVGSDTAVTPLQITLDQGLRDVHYELMVERDWIDSDEFVQGSIRALRWTFDWTLIGEWQLVIPIR